MENHIELTYEQYAEIANIGGKDPIGNARKRIKDKFGFPTKITEVEVNGKKVGKAVALIPESHYKELLRSKGWKEFSSNVSEDVSSNGNLNNIDNIQEVEFETVSNHDSTLKSSEFSSIDMNKFLEKLETASYRVGYLEGVLNQVEPKVKLLEDSESKTKDEYYRLQAENRELKAKLEALNFKLEDRQNRLTNWFKRL